MTSSKDRTHDGTAFRMLTLIDEHTRECLTIEVQRKLRSGDVLYAFADAMRKHGIPRYIRSDNGPEFIALALREWFERIVVQTLFIEPGSPWENGYNGSFNGKLRDELLKGEIFCSLKEAKILIEQWRQHYNTVRPHSSLGYRPPAPETKSSLQIHIHNTKKHALSSDLEAVGVSKLRKFVFLLVSVTCVSIAYLYSIFHFSLQTLVVKNHSDIPIVVTVYDLSWTVEPDAKVVKRFRSNKGDGGYTILNKDTQTVIGGAGYLTSSSPMCTTLTISNQSEYDVKWDREVSFCHLLHW